MTDDQAPTAPNPSDSSKVPSSTSTPPTERLCQRHGESILDHLCDPVPAYGLSESELNSTSPDNLQNHQFDNLLGHRTYTPPPVYRPLVSDPNSSTPSDSATPSTPSTAPTASPQPPTVASPDRTPRVSAEEIEEISRGIVERSRQKFGRKTNPPK